MVKEIQLGPETKVSLKSEGGQVKIGLVYVGKQAGAEVLVSLDAEQFGQLIKDAIPGKIDDAIVDVIVAAFKIL